MADLGVISTLFLAYLPLLSSASPPYLVDTSSKTYGPDGPWNAVQILLGSDHQPIDMFPGGLTSSFTLTKNTCSGGLQCGAAGVFDPSTSDTFSNTSYAEVYDGECYDIGALSFYTKLFVATDQLLLHGPASNNEHPQLLSNFSLALIDEFDIKFPSGAGYPLQAGQLSLGPSANFSLKGTGNTNLIPGALADGDAIPSSSFGLHYGSAAFNQSLSLWLGGYDQQRLIGPVSSQPVDGNQQFQIDLLDIGLNVSSGASPFTPPAQQGLLAKNNATIGTSPLPVWMNTGAPYLFLPNSTCAAITANLPVTFNPKFSLYTWNTTSPAYTAIVTSPAYLSFTFRLNADSSNNFTISVPFALLNLTLDTTLVDTPTQYFPCQDPGIDGRYSLGRAFLQSAFLGANWDLSPQEWYLAQAPGPNVASQPSPIPFPSTAPSSSANLWPATWEGFLKPLADSNGSSLTATDVPPPGPNKLSGGAIAGIVIGVLVGLALVLVGAALLFRRSRRRARRVEGAEGEGEKQGMWIGEERTEYKSELSQGHERNVHEIGSGENQGKVYEVGSGEVASSELGGKQGPRSELDGGEGGGSAR